MPSEIERIETGLPFDPNSGDSGMAFITLRFLGAANHICPPYWSYARDTWLRDFWRSVDPVKIAVKTFISKATTIPFKIIPADYSIEAHISQSRALERSIDVYSGVMRGWHVEFKKFVNDYLTQDNGAFFIVMGGGNPAGPIVGSPTGVFHLDSSRCRRTGDLEYPVLYQHIDGKLYKLHYTRVIYISDTPSPDADLYGVGFSSVSSCLKAGQELDDISTHSSEKLGSRPARQILYAKTGATLDNLLTMVKVGQAKLDAENLQVFSKTLLAAPKSATGTLELDTVDLSSVPDGFNRMETTILDMAVIAAAFGLNLHDLAMSFGVRSNTSSDQAAEVQDRKGRGKGVGDLLEVIKKEFDNKVLPGHLLWSFDQQDDEQDEQQGNIWNIRSQARERDLRSGSTTVRAERERMLDMGEISEELFASMELSDGRLPDGTDVIYLFYTSDTYISGLLSLPGIEKPTNQMENDPYVILPLIDDAVIEAWKALEVARTARVARKTRQAIAALEILRATYQGIMEQEIAEAEAQAELDAEAVAEGTEEIPDDSAEESVSDTEVSSGSSEYANAGYTNGNGTTKTVAQEFEIARILAGR